MENTVVTNFEVCNNIENTGVELKKAEYELLYMMLYLKFLKHMFKKKSVWKY